MRKAILAALILLASGFTFVGGSEQGQAWQLKADAPLLAAFAAEADPLTIIVQGPAIPLPVAPLANRAEWRAYWEAEAAPFLEPLRAYAAAFGGEVRTEVPAVNAAFLTVPHKNLAPLLEHPDIRRAGLDWEDAVQILDAPSGPGITADLGDTLAKVQAQDMWGLGYRGAGVSLAVLDTGIRSTHEMMRNADGTTRVVSWFDATTNPGGPGYCANPCDANGHGTHVATTAAGSNLYNPSSPQGVAPEAEVWGVRIFQGSGGPWEVAQAGLQWAFDAGADITTNSWGGGCFGAGIVTAELAETLQTAGMMNVFAAGNSGFSGVRCPGMVDNVLTVGGIDVNDNIYSSSSRGPCEWPVGSGNVRTCPDVNAVAVNVVAGWYTSDTAYQSLTGTSMATPHVAGVVVLLEQAKRELTGEGFDAPSMQVENLLKDTAKDLGPAGPDNSFGWGTAQARDAFADFASAILDSVIPWATVDAPEIGQADVGEVRFGVLNISPHSVEGTLRLDISQVEGYECPAICHTETSYNAPLHLGQGEAGGGEGTLDGALLPSGEYEATATYLFTYEEDGNPVSETVQITVEFTIRKVEWHISRAVPPAVATGTPLDSGTLLRNVGNDNATGVRFQETFRADGFLPVAPVPPGEGYLGIFANPAPSAVGYKTLNPPVLRYEFAEIGNIGAGGQTWEADYDFLAGHPGTYVFGGTLWYSDWASTQHMMVVEDTVAVTLP